MNKLLILSMLTLIINACSSIITITPNPSTTPFTTTSIGTSSVTVESSFNVRVKKVSIVDKYVIEIPEDFIVYENLSSSTTVAPIYRIESSNGVGFDIVVHPYTVSSSLIPGKCIVSTDFDTGTTSAPIFCEGLELTDSFTVSTGWIVKYGSSVTDISQASCTMNSPCPVEISPETRYSTTYVFVIADKSLNAILEFYVGDAFRSSSNEINGFEGLGSVLSDSIIPSLTTRNP